MDYSSIGATNQAKTTPNPARVAKLVEMNEPIQTQPAEVKLRKSAASETGAGAQIGKLFGEHAVKTEIETEPAIVL